MRPTQAVHFAVIARDVDRDQEAGFAFLPTPRTDDVQGGPLPGKLGATPRPFPWFPERPDHRRVVKLVRLDLFFVTLSLSDT